MEKIRVAGLGEGEPCLCPACKIRCALLFRPNRYRDEWVIKCRSNSVWYPCRYYKVFEDVLQMERILKQAEIERAFRG